MGSERNKRNERIGEVGYNRHGEKMIIVDYVNRKDISVMFEDGSIREHVRWSEFVDGSLNNHYSTRVYGVGIPGYRKKKIDGKLTKEYRTWVNMLARCYYPPRQEKFPRYKGCSVSEEWLLFDNFLEWCHEQENWNKVVENPSEFHLDKDIITKGNKIYSLDNCCFVPATINTLFIFGNKSRGKYPLGVSKQYDKFRAFCSMKQIGEKNYYAVFDTPEEAFYAYKEKREFVIKEVAKREYALGNITKKCYESMMNYQVEITD